MDGRRVFCTVSKRPNYKIFRPSIEGEAGDSFTANFGGSPFAYPIPAGYESLPLKVGFDFQSYWSAL